MNDARRKWTPERAALLDGLLDDGWTHKMIAGHPSIESTPAAVALFISRRGKPRESRSAFMPAGVLNLMRPAAKARSMTRVEVATSILRVLGADPSLLDNVLDDGVTT